MPFLENMRPAYKTIESNQYFRPEKITYAQCNYRRISKLIF
jgi:hypothetical protein